MKPSDITPLWLSHHWPGDYDRCVKIKSAHVCRRCIFLYPISLASIVATLALTSNPPGWLFPLLAAPALIEFCVEHLAQTRYSPLRQVVSTVPAGIGLGIGFAAYLQDQTSLWFLGTAVIFVIIGSAAAFIGNRQRPDTE